MFRFGKLERSIIDITSMSIPADFDLNNTIWVCEI
jgi:hypothetical protein